MIEDEHQRYAFDGMPWHLCGSDLSTLGTVRYNAFVEELEGLYHHKRRDDFWQLVRAHGLHLTFPDPTATPISDSSSVRVRVLCVRGERLTPALTWAFLMVDQVQPLSVAEGAKSEEGGRVEEKPAPEEEEEEEASADDLFDMIE